MKRIEYPITPEYVSHWGEWEAARELIQNAIDSPPFTVEHEDGCLTVTNEGELVLKDFLLGFSNKGAGSIGKYGEGLNLSLLVAARMGLRLIIRSGTMLITSAIEWSDTFDSEVLVIYIDDLVAFGTGTTATMLCNDFKYVKDMPLGIVKGDGLIYVHGLYVCRIPGLEYNANFLPGQITLNRDRNAADIWDVSREITRMIPRTTLLDDCIQNKLHINRCYVQHDVLKEQWEDKYPDAEPILYGEKKKGVVVPDWLYKILGFFRREKKDPIIDWAMKWNINEQAIKELNEILIAYGASNV